MIDLLISIAISVAAFIVLLAFIVFIHEYGHFKVARLCGVRVETFSIGFGNALFKWTDKKGTVWKIASIPLGGFVKFFGDANAASAGTSASKEGEEHEEHPLTTQFNSERDRLAALLTEEEKKVCFHFKPVWQRMAIVAAGPFANFILGAVIFATMFMAVGIRSTEPVIGYVSPETPAAEAGFERGDRIVSLNGRKITALRQIQTRVKIATGEDLRFGILRDGEEIELVATPHRVSQKDGFGNEVNAGQLGFEAYIPPKIGAVGRDSPAEKAGLLPGDVLVMADGQEIYSFYDLGRVIEGRGGETIPLEYLRETDRLVGDVEILTHSLTTKSGETFSYETVGLFPVQEPLRRMNVAEAAIAGPAQVGEVIGVTLRFLGRLVTFKEDPRQVGGPIKMAKFAGQAAQAGFDPVYADLPLGERILISLQIFINLAALISVSIGLMNILPIPVLDGGHLVYYAYEAIAGRPLSDRIQGIGFRIGLAVVGTFMIFVIFNDVMGLF